MGDARIHHMVNLSGEDFEGMNWAVYFQGRVSEKSRPSPQ